MHMVTWEGIQLAMLRPEVKGMIREVESNERIASHRSTTNDDALRIFVAYILRSITD